METRRHCAESAAEAHAAAVVALHAKGLPDTAPAQRIGAENIIHHCIYDAVGFYYSFSSGVSVGW